MFKPDDNLFVKYLAESSESLASVESDLLAIEKERENLVFCNRSLINQ